MNDKHTDVSTAGIASISCTALAASLNLSDRQMRDRLRAFKIPIVKVSREPRVFLCNVARLIVLAQRVVEAGPPASSKRNTT